MFWPPEPPAFSPPYAPLRGDSVEVAGWAIEPDHDGSHLAKFHVYRAQVSEGPGGQRHVGRPRFDGEFRGYRTPRPDVEAAFPQFGSENGFRRRLTVPHGTWQLCLYAINEGEGEVNDLLGCKEVIVDRNPFGALDVVTATGGSGVRVEGWAIEPDRNWYPPEVHIYVDGVGAAIIKWGTPRPDVKAAFPAYGLHHGFGWDGTVSPGTHRICAYAIHETGGDRNTELGCRTVTV